MAMRTRLLLALALVVAGIIGLALLSVVPPSELAKKGVRTNGEVLFKDSRPGADGSFTYTVTFVFPDASQRNHQVTRIVPDKRIWESLSARQDVKVLYMPDRPEEASIAGAEGLARPHAQAYAFLCWSSIIAGFVVGVLALRSGETGKRDAKPGPPSVTRGGGS